jgi:hypothetical protein
VPEPEEALCARQGLDIFLGGDDIEKKKPDPQIYNEAARRLGVQPDECVVIEDSMVGLRVCAPRLRLLHSPALTRAWHQGPDGVGTRFSDLPSSRSSPSVWSEAWPGWAEPASCSPHAQHDDLRGCSVAIRAWFPQLAGP